MDHYRTGVRLLQFAPELRVFAERNGGLMILFSLVIAADLDDTMPPTRPVRVSISELARRFSVSRVHVGRLLRDAEAEGPSSQPEARRTRSSCCRRCRARSGMPPRSYSCSSPDCARAAMADVGEE